MASVNVRGPATEAVGVAPEVAVGYEYPASTGRGKGSSPNR